MDPLPRVQVVVARPRELSLLRRLRLRWWKARTLGVSAVAPAQWYVVALVGSGVASVLEVVQREATLDGKSILLGLVGGVMTVPRLEGRGMASRVLERAVEFIGKDLGCEFAFLVCGEDTVAFYERLGWQSTPNTFVYEQPDGETVGRLRPMVFPCQGRPFPDGLLNLRGLPV